MKNHVLCQDFPAKYVDSSIGAADVLKSTNRDERDVYCCRWNQEIYVKQHFRNRLLKPTQINGSSNSGAQASPNEIKVFLSFQTNILHFYGRGCGSVGRAVTSKTRHPQFESRHWQNFIYQFYNRKEIQEEEAGNGTS